MADESKKNNFQNTVDSLFKGMDGFMTTKTVVGDAITVGDTIILPLVDVSFGMGATAKAEGVKSGGGGGIGRHGRGLNTCTIPPTMARVICTPSPGPRSRASAPNAPAASTPASSMTFKLLFISVAPV